MQAGLSYLEPIKMLIKTISFPHEDPNYFGFLFNPPISMIHLICRNNHGLPHAYKEEPDFIELTRYLRCITGLHQLKEYIPTKKMQMNPFFFNWKNLVKTVTTLSSLKLMQELQ